MIGFLQVYCHLSEPRALALQKKSVRSLARMVRKLKYHEAKLLKKVDFIDWKSDRNLREVKLLRRYHIQDREDYHTYNKVVGMITKLTTMLSHLDQRDPVRIETTDLLLDRLYSLGLIQNKRLIACDKIAASTLCRRRLPVVLVRLKLAETMKEAVSLVEQGHIRVGPHPVTDPSFLVSRAMEDYVTWVDTSRIKRTIMKCDAPPCPARPCSTPFGPSQLCTTTRMTLSPGSVPLVTLAGTMIVWMTLIYSEGLLFQLTDRTLYGTISSLLFICSRLIASASRPLVCSSQ